MLFNSYIFIFLFLPLALTGYYLLNYFKKYRVAGVFLTGMSLWFYGYFNKSYLVIICGSIAINYLLSALINRGGVWSEKVIRKIILAFGIFANIAVIFYFKYFDFFIENINSIFEKTFELKNIALPLGISFFTFQQISYLVDSYREETKNYTFDEYALFVSFFPQLVAGPIVLHNELVPQFRNYNKRSFIPKNFSKGIYIFSAGLFKKIIIADIFGVAVTYGYGTIFTLSSLEALLVSLFYTFQLYFDFSGYCDMASGIGYMFNIRLPQNFNSPYKATSITDFWSRWHMSLTRFLRTYIYIPLGGNRKGNIRTYINIMVVYFVSGIWHGANWTFILWGVLHGFFNCLDRLFKNQWEKLGKVTQWFITFMLVNMLWILFRAENISSAKLFIKNMCSLSSFTINGDLYNCFNLAELSYLEEKIPFLSYLVSHITGFNLWLFVFGAFFVVLNTKNSKEKEFRPTVLNSLTVVVFLVWSVVSFAGISTFLYFDF
ncbi:MAG: MBOAT family protein [Lachnospiraceae bacterium]|nr:MBOAT family protein [Lachnospiraceae bacterium]